MERERVFPAGFNLLGRDVRTAPEEDAALVAAAKRDCLKFAELYRRYHGRVFSYVRLRSSSPEDAADLTHLVFLKALDALPRYEERGIPFSAWLMRIARNVAIDAARKHRPTVTPDLVPELQLGDEGANPEHDVLEQERWEQLRTALSRLDSDKRDLLALRFTAGLSSREIGLVVGKSESAVKKQFTRTLQSLREELTDEMA
jgi:RNA polymerase sigma-70 factor (ECF subfamily)